MQGDRATDSVIGFAEMADPKIYEADLERDFAYDDRNANKGTPRGRGMLERSISKLGAGRSLVADRNGKIVAGNKTREALAGAKMRRAIVVETDGTVPVVVKRTDWDLDDRKGPAREYAYADNRIAEVDLDWDHQLLQEDHDLISDYFPDQASLTQEELDAIFQDQDQRETDGKIVLKFSSDIFETVTAAIRNNGQTPEQIMLGALGIK